jgi:hypothetical protein
LSSCSSRRSRFAANNCPTSLNAGRNNTRLECRKINSRPNAARKCILPRPGRPKANTLTAFTLAIAHAMPVRPAALMIAVITAFRIQASLRVPRPNASCAADWPTLTHSPEKNHTPLFQDIILTQILARRLAVHPCFHCTHTDGSSLVALDYELGELGSRDHNPEQHPPPRPASNSMLPPEKPPLQWVILIVVRG